MFYKHFVNCREKSRRVALDCKTFRLDSGLRFCVVPLALPRARNGRFWVLRSYRLNELEREVMSSRPEDFHLQALPNPCMTLSSHTAPDVRPFPWHSGQWAKSLGFARRSRANQSLAPLVRWTNRLNLRRAHRMT